MKMKYIKPVLIVVPLFSRNALLAGSLTGTLSDDTTDTAYSRDFDFDDEEQVLMTERDSSLTS